MTIKVIDLIEMIDEKYIDAKKRKLSRFDTQWGAWSREMNVDIRTRIKHCGDSEALRLKYVMLYWTLKSQLLELYYKSRFTRRVLKNKLSREADVVKKNIVNNGALPDMSDNDLAKTLMGLVMVK